MSIINGIIQAPVSIADVRTVLGETSNDLATLCKSEKINMWAKFKPVELNKPFTSDEFDFENRKWKVNNAVLRCRFLHIDNKFCKMFDTLL